MANDGIDPVAVDGARDVLRCKLQLVRMTPREFLYSIVQPNVDDFHSNFGDLRHAYNAINAVDALAAHLYAWAKTNAPAAVVSVGDDSHYRAILAARNPGFALLRDIAKAQKHVHLTKHNPQVTRADQVVARTIGWSKGSFGEGRFGGVKQVVVDAGSSKFSYLENIVDSSLTFLEAEMSALGA